MGVLSPRIMTYPSVEPSSLMQLVVASPPRVYDVTEFLPGASPDNAANIFTLTSI